MEAIPGRKKDSRLEGPSGVSIAMNLCQSLSNSSDASALSVLFVFVPD